MVETTLTVNHPVGLHARPAAVFVQKAREFKSKITIQNMSREQSKEVPVSAFNLLQIGVRSGHEVRIRAEGDDADQAVAALTQLIRENFGEA